MFFFFFFIKILLLEEGDVNNRHSQVDLDKKYNFIFDETLNRNVGLTSLVIDINFISVNTRGTERVLCYQLPVRILICLTISYRRIETNRYARITLVCSSKTFTRMFANLSPGLKATFG